LPVEGDYLSINQDQKDRLALHLYRVWCFSPCRINKTNSVPRLRVHCLPLHYTSEQQRQQDDAY
jgi:hypothetical protein